MKGIRIGDIYNTNKKKSVLLGKVVESYGILC